MKLTVKITHPLPLFLALAIVGASASLAAPLAVVNAGFEDITGETISNEFTFGPLTGWALYEAPGLDTSGGNGPDFYIGTLTPQLNTETPEPGDFAFFPDGAAEGNRVGIAFNFAGRPNTGGGLEYGLSQTLGATLLANTQYTLQIDIGNIASGTSMDGSDFNLAGFPGYRVDLLAGATVLASDNNTLAGSIAEGTFALSTVIFTTGAAHTNLGQNLGIRLVNLNVTDPSAPGADLEVDFDNVRLDATAVPEPSAAALISLGMLGLLALCRRNAHRR